jgi:hypothetical protein
MIADAPASPNISVEEPTYRKPSSAVSLAVLDDIEDLLPYRADLENLADELSVQNVSYEPWAMFSIVPACSDRLRLVFVLIFDNNAKYGKRLIGFFPFERIWVHPLMPLSCLRLWADPFNYLNARCDPLVRRGEEACINALIDWFLQGDANATLLNLRGLTGSTELIRSIEHRLLLKPAPRYFHTMIESHLYRRQASADTYINSILSSKSQQTLRRYERRLRDLGPLEYKDVDDCTSITALADEFIDLESRGWKGQKGVSVASYGHGGIIKEILIEAHRRRRLSLLTLRIAGTLVAARCVFLAKPGSFLFKLTYDESELYAKRSPGLLLEMEAIRRLHSDNELLGNGIAWMDTCASPFSSIFSRSRSEPLPVHRYVIARPQTAASLALMCLPHALGAATRLKERYSALQRFRKTLWSKLPSGAQEIKRDNSMHHQPGGPDA